MKKVLMAASILAITGITALSAKEHTYSASKSVVSAQDTTKKGSKTTTTKDTTSTTTTKTDTTAKQ